MIQNRTTQLIFQSFFCAIGVIGTVASLGLFDMVWRWDFYIHFTNLSNYLCVGIMFAELVQTARKKEDSYVSTLPLLKFINSLGILLTKSGGEFFGKVGSFESDYEFDAIVLDDSCLEHPQQLNVLQRLERAVYLSLDVQGICAKYVNGNQIF